MYFKIQASFKTDTSQICFKWPFLQTDKVVVLVLDLRKFIKERCFLKKKKKK